MLLQSMAEGPEAFTMDVNHRWHDWELMWVANSTTHHNSAINERHGPFKARAHSTHYLGRGVPAVTTPTRHIWNSKHHTAIVDP